MSHVDPSVLSSRPSVHLIHSRTMPSTYQVTIRILRRDKMPREVIRKAVVHLTVHRTNRCHRISFDLDRLIPFRRSGPMCSTAPQEEEISTLRRRNRRRVRPRLPSDFERFANVYLAHRIRSNTTTRSKTLNLCKSTKITVERRETMTPTEAVELTKSLN